MRLGSPHLFSLLLKCVFINECINFSVCVWRGCQLYHSSTGSTKATIIAEWFSSPLHLERNLSAWAKTSSTCTAWFNRHQNLVPYKRYQISFAWTNCVDTSWLQGKFRHFSSSFSEKKSRFLMQNHWFRRYSIAKLVEIVHWKIFVHWIVV